MREEENTYNVYIRHRMKQASIQENMNNHIEQERGGEEDERR